jgi:hypothetical protein
VSWLDVLRHGGPAPLSSEGDLPSFDGATWWLNSPPVIASDVRGKVVLVDFWTYTCINWLRTLSNHYWPATFEITFLASGIEADVFTFG